MKTKNKLTDCGTKIQSYRKIIFGTMAIVCMVLIFSFSARTGDTSTEDSHHIGKWIGQTFVLDFAEWSVEEQEKFAARIDHPIRKSAHATEYAVLGMLLLGTFVDHKVVGWKRFAIPWSIATLYAATDEFHQLFVPDRSGQIKDVCIDSAGALVGIIVLLGICWGFGLVRQGRKTV